MNPAMHVRRRPSDPWLTAIRLAVVLSAAAALVVLLLGPAVPQPLAVLTVLTVGFCTSWVLTGRDVEPARAPRATARCRRHTTPTTRALPGHRVAVVPVRRAVG